jgi:hypothetical protein
MSCHVSRLRRMAPNLRPPDSSASFITLIAERLVVIVFGLNSSEPPPLSFR